MSYAKLPLVNISDDESDDEEHIFSKTNGQHYGDLELQLMPSGKSTLKTKIRTPNITTNHKCYKKLCIIGAVIALVIGILLLVTVIVQKNKDHHVQTYFKQTREWKILLEDKGSESCIHLMDVDGDGRQDILFGVAESVDLHDLMENKTVNLKKFCEKKGREYPCIGSLVALRGYDGQVLWKAPTRSAVIFMNCDDIDVNGDGSADCIVTGRQATTQAIDVANNGSLLWLADTEPLMEEWNIYKALTLPDLDADGVPDILISHGGNPSKEPEDLNRESGRLIILSGATGQMIGERYLKMPDSKETYMSPILYTCTDGSLYVLFGSGGETVPGDLMMISVPDLYRYVMHKGKNAQVPKTIRGNYKQWPKKGRGINEIITLYMGFDKGVMVPPVILDINSDGIDDILVSAYDGKLILVNGENLHPEWVAEFKGMESYSTPAPGYFDNDNILDFMVHWNTGAWPQYNDSMTYIISGEKGEILWSMKSSVFEMSSDFTIKTSEPYRDMFLFRVSGREEKIVMDINGVKHGVGVQRKIIKRHGPSEEHRSQDEDGDRDNYEKIRQDYAAHHFLCTEDIRMTAEVFLMDRTLQDRPIKLLEYGTENYTYVPVQRFDHRVPSNKTFCVVNTPQDRTTGAIGDLDGDGTLDAVMMTEILGELVDERFSYDKMKYNIYINKINIETLLSDKTARTKVNVSLKMETDNNDKDISDIKILPLEKQTWTEYLGKFHSSWLKVT